MFGKQTNKIFFFLSAIIAAALLLSGCRVSSPGAGSSVSFTETSEEEEPPTVRAEETAVPPAAPTDIDELRELFHNRTILYAGHMRDGVLCFVSRDTEANLRAAFLTADTNRLIAQAELPAAAAYFRANGDTLFAVERPVTSEAKIYACDMRGELLSQVQYAPKIDLPRMQTFIFQAMGSVAINVSCDAFLCLCLWEQPQAAYKVNMKTGERQKIVIPSEMMPTGLPAFAGERFLARTGENDQSVTRLLDLNGNELSSFQNGRYQNAAGNGPFVVLYDASSVNPTAPKDAQVTVIDCESGTARTLTLTSPKEAQWANISDDGKTVLTFDGETSFFVYDTESGTCLNAFRLENVRTGLRPENTFIDSVAKKLYIGTSDPDPAEEGREIYNVAVIEYTS